MLIKNIHLLSALDENALLRLEQAALAHQRFSKITFKVIEFTDKALTINVIQGKSANENHQDQKRLIEIGKETFANHVGTRKINVHAVPYVASPVEVVTPEWISKQMLAHKVALKYLVKDFGIDKTTLSALINGKKPLSQPVKGLFYYFFKSLGAN
jgi:hypothetical protein